MTLATFAVEIALLLAVALSKAGQMWRETRLGLAVGPRWPVVIVVVSLAVGIAVGLPRRFSDLNYTVPGLALQVGQNLALIGTFLALQLLYLPAAKDGSHRRPIIREVSFAMTVCFVAVVLLAVYAAFNIPTHYIAKELQRPGVAVFYVLVESYVLYVTACVVARSARYARRIDEWPLQVGLVVTGLGCLGQLVACVLRNILVLDAVAFGDVPAVGVDISSVALNLGKGLIAVGLIVPLCVGRSSAARLWIARLCTFQRLRGLWDVVAVVFPEVIRRPQVGAQPPRGAPIRWSWWRIRPHLAFRYTGRVTECRDGVGRARGHIDAQDPEGSLPERFAAELLACDGFSSNEYDADLDADARHLAEVSRRIKRRGTGWLRDPSIRVKPHAPSTSPVDTMRKDAS